MLATEDADTSEEMEVSLTTRQQGELVIIV